MNLSTEGWLTELQRDNEDILPVHSLHPRRGTDQWPRLLRKDELLHSFCAGESLVFAARKIHRVGANYLTQSLMTHFLCEVTASVSSRLTEGRTRARGKCRTHRQHSASSGRTYAGDSPADKNRSEVKHEVDLSSWFWGEDDRRLPSNKSGCWAATSSRLLINKQHGCHGD